MSSVRIPNLRVGLAGAQRDNEENQVVKRASCNLASGDLYTYPNTTTTSHPISLPSNNALTFKWNTDCLTSSTVDIYLYSGGAGLIHWWVNAPYATGSYDATLDPTWWNGTASAQLQLLIVDSGTPRFLTTAPSGPIFTVNLDTTVAAGISSSKAANVKTVTTGGTVVTTTGTEGNTQPTFQVVSLPGLSSSKHTLPAGSIAAAILVPLLAIAVAIGVYVRFARAREAEKRKRWSEHVDRRMSTLSQDWRSGAGIPPAGRASGVGSRRSIAMGGGSPGDRQTKASSYFGRTSSTYATEGNFAGAGAGSRVPRQSRIAVPTIGADGQPEMTQVRSSIFLNNGSGDAASMANLRQSRVSFAGASAAAPRMSRVSFGDQPRPSIGGLSGATRSTPALVTPDRADRRPTSAYSARATGRSLDGDIAVSPSQAQGPFSVSETHLPGLSAKQGKKDGVFGGIAGALGLGKKKEKEAAQNLERQRTREEEWRQAEATRRSGDHVRDMEATVLARRSKAMSQYSTHSNTAVAAPPTARTHDQGRSNIPSAYHTSVYGIGNADGDDERMEELDGNKGQEVQEPARAASPMGMVMPAPGMNPDELLAAYAAARARGTTPVPAGTMSIDQAVASTELATPEGHLRPQSSGDKNPFRQSMISDTSRYSAADGESQAK